MTRVTATTTTYHLRAVTDAATAKVHLGATEKGAVTFCGVRLIEKGDKRFGGRFRDRPFTASADLAAVDCGACKRGAAWKDRKGSTWTAPAPKATRSRAAAKDAG
jgi:hypothetical protein